MHPVLLKYLSKLFIQQWVIGIGECRLDEILGRKLFDPVIQWMEVPSADRFIADPFLLKTEEGKYRILYEDYTFSAGYGHIAQLDVTDQLSLANGKKILDTHSHLSYPFIFRENGKCYVFPEAARSGKLCCYEYDPADGKMELVHVVVDQPLLDATILRHKDRYWLFCTKLGAGEDRQLHLYYADSLLGNYTAHPMNPVKDDVSGSRPAGAIIEYKGDLFRPAQDSRYTYGGGMVINKITRLDEKGFSEEMYMRINPGNNSGKKAGIRGMHTLNMAGEMLVTDGTRWRFSPVIKFRQLMMKFKISKIQEAGKN